jgi:hypothetical protein
VCEYVIAAAFFWLRNFSAPPPPLVNPPEPTSCVFPDLTATRAGEMLSFETRNWILWTDALSLAARALCVRVQLWIAKLLFLRRSLSVLVLVIALFMQRCGFVWVLTRFSTPRLTAIAAEWHFGQQLMQSAWISLIALPTELEIVLVAGIVW